jgi:hypothetical protein
MLVMVIRPSPAQATSVASTSQAAPMMARAAFVVPRYFTSHAISSLVDTQLPSIPYVLLQTILIIGRTVH